MTMLAAGLALCCRERSKDVLESIRPTSKSHTLVPKLQLGNKEVRSKLPTRYFSNPEPSRNSQTALDR
jgi:hypothetical protein